MQLNWKNWCRLCSNCDDEHIDFDYTFTNSENFIKISDTLQNFIKTLVSPLEITNSSSNVDYPSKVCKNCLNNMNYLDKFIANTLKSNEMFLEIITNYSESQSISLDEDVLKAVRNKFHGTFNFHSDNEFNNSKIIMTLSEIDNKTKKFNHEANSNAITVETTNNIKTEEKIIDPKTSLSICKNKIEVNNDMDNDQKVEKNKTRVRARIRSSTRDLKNKVSTSLPQKNIYKCESCEKTFNKIQNYNQHVDSKNCIGGVFTCTQCTKTFTSLKNLKIHSRIHVPKEEKRTHPCDYCGKNFEKTVNLTDHIKAVHLYERPFICEECGKAFTLKRVLQEHQVIHKDESPFACTYCPLKLKSHARLKVHEDTHSDTKYECTQCGLKLNTKNGLRGHMVCHSNERKYKCQFCGNSYKRKKTLNIHMILHTDQRPYICPYCENSFTSSSNCRTHQKKNHPEEFKATFGRPPSETMKRTPSDDSSIALLK